MRKPIHRKGVRDWLRRCLSPLLADEGENLFTAKAQRTQSKTNLSQKRKAQTNSPQRHKGHKEKLLLVKTMAQNRLTAKAQRTQSKTYLSQKRKPRSVSPQRRRGRKVKHAFRKSENLKASHRRDAEDAEENESFAKPGTMSPKPQGPWMAKEEGSAASPSPPQAMGAAMNRFLPTGEETHVPFQSFPAGASFRCLKNFTVCSRPCCNWTWGCQPRKRAALLTSRKFLRRSPARWGPLNGFS